MNWNIWKFSESGMARILTLCTSTDLMRCNFPDFTSIFHDIMFLIFEWICCQTSSKYWSWVALSRLLFPCFSFKFFTNKTKLSVKILLPSYLNLVELNKIDKSINKGEEPELQKQKQIEITQKYRIVATHQVYWANWEPDKIKTVHEILRPNPPKATLSTQPT